MQPAADTNVSRDCGGARISLTSAHVLTGPVNGKQSGKFVKPTSFYRRSDPSRPFGGADPSIGSATWVEAKICLGYSAIILVAAGIGGSAASLVRWWIHVTSVLTDAVLVFMSMPDAWAEHPYETAVYRHLLTASILLTVATFLGFRHRWVHWGRRAEMIVRQMARGQEKPDEIAQTGYYQMVLGTAATIMLMLYADQLLESLTETLYAQSWTFLRSPLLAILAFALACNAVALRLACRGCARKAYPNK